MNNIIINKTKSNLKTFYENDGYVAIKNAISQKSLERFRKDFYELSIDGDCSQVDYSKIDKQIIELNKTDRSALHKLQIIASKLSSFHSLVWEIHKYLVQINQSKNHLFFKSLGFVLGVPESQRLAYDWHQDGTYHGKNNGESVTHVWFPIFYPTTIRNGTMSFLDKSHKLGLLDYENIKLETNGYTTHKVVGIESIVEKHEELYCELEPGDCVFFDDNIIHKSNINHTDLCRIVGVMKFSSNISDDVHSGLVGV